MRFCLRVVAVVDSPELVASQAAVAVALAASDRSGRLRASRPEAFQQIQAAETGAAVQVRQPLQTLLVRLPKMVVLAVEESGATERHAPEVSPSVVAVAAAAAADTRPPRATWRRPLAATSIPQRQP